MNRNAMILALAAVAAMLLVPACAMESPASADTGLEGNNVWICYGRNVVVEDRHYDPDTYSHIEWRYSRTQADLGSQDPVAETVLKFTVPFEICADDSVIQYFVRETAIVSGAEMSEDLIVMINPSSYMRYVQFMYNDGTDTVYKHAPITTKRCYHYGDELLAEIPYADPIRPGYAFGGWYEDPECTKAYGKLTYRFFDASHTTRLYAKWTPDASQHPGLEMVKIDLRPVDGLSFQYGGLVIPKGDDFSYTVSVMDLYSFDLTDASSLSVHDNRVLTKSDVKYDDKNRPSSMRFTLTDVVEDSLVILSNTGRLYYIHEDMHDSRIATGYENPTNNPLNLRMEPLNGYNGVNASVWMNGVNVTGNVVFGNWINIPTVNGDIYIFAYGAHVEGKDAFPWWIVALCAAAIILALILALLLRNRRSLVLSSSDSSFDPLPEESIDGKSVQTIVLREGCAPAHAMIRKGKDCTRIGYAFASANLPGFLSMDRNGTITLVGTPSGSGTFRVNAVDASSGKDVCSAEFGYRAENSQSS